MFTFVGNVDPETLKPLVEKYIGSLPTTKKPMNWIDDKTQPVQGEITDDFRIEMQQPKVSVYYYFSGINALRVQGETRADVPHPARTRATSSRSARRRAGTYGVSVKGSTDYIPDESYDMTISFDTNEEMADELCEIIMQEIRQIVENGPKSEDIEKTREYLLKSLKNSLEINSGWLGYIQAKYGSGLNFVQDYEPALRALTAADVQAMAKKVLAEGNLVKVVMRPEKAADAGEEAK